MKEQIEKIRQAAAEALANIAAAEELEAVRVRFLGKKGELTAVLKGLGSVSPEERSAIGQLANEVRAHVEEEIARKKADLQVRLQNEKLKKEVVDVTMPGKKQELASRHPLRQVEDRLNAIFMGMGFSIAEGPEVELDYYNFEALNIPKDHPARDMQDTFYITEEILLRTHTSPVQARTLDKHDFAKGPLKMISPGRVFRRDTDDATHSHQFHQIEGLVVGENISMGDLKGTLEMIIKKMFGEDRKIRLRPSYFPFTEPSVEVDVSCFKCGGKGCNVCKKTGWIEILGAGMVHPRVLEMSGVDSEKYSGFAFGLGQERIAMLRYGINDIRGFYQGDMRFSEQFKS